MAFPPPILVVLLQRQEPMSNMDRRTVRKMAIFFGPCVCECVCEMLAFLLSQLCFLEQIIQRKREKLCCGGGWKRMTRWSGSGPLEGSQISQPGEWGNQSKKSNLSNCTFP